MAIGMPNKRRAAQILSGEGISFVIGVQVVDYRIHMIASPRQTGAAAATSGLYKEFIIAGSIQSVQSEGAPGGYASRFEIAVFSFAEENLTAFLIGIQPVKADGMLFRCDAADVNVTYIKKEGFVGRIAPVCIGFHRMSLAL